MSLTRKIQKIGRALKSLPDPDSIIISGEDVALLFNKLQPLWREQISEELLEVRDRIMTENSISQANIVNKAINQAILQSERYCEQYVPSLLGQELAECSTIKKLQANQPNIGGIQAQIEGLKLELIEAKSQAQEARAEATRLSQELSQRPVMTDHGEELASLRQKLEEVYNRPSQNIQSLTTQDVNFLIQDYLSKMEVMNPVLVNPRNQEEDWTNFDFSSGASKKATTTETTKLTESGQMFRVDQFKADNPHIPTPKISKVLQDLISRSIITTTTETNTYRVI